MAAGEGRRLRPITERWPKPILPIDGRAVVGVLVRQLGAALRRGGGGGGGRPPGRAGAAAAGRRALDGGAGLPAIVTAADTVFRPGDLARVAGAEGAAGAVAYRPDPSKARIAIADGVVTEVVSSDQSLPFSSAPAWLLTREIDLSGLPGPPFELAAAFQRAIDAGKRVAAVEIGPTRDLTTPIDLARENFPYLGR